MMPSPGEIWVHKEIPNRFRYIQAVDVAGDLITVNTDNNVYDSSFSFTLSWFLTNY